MSLCASIFCATLSLTVIDGDTVRQGSSIYRLVGFNSPELSSDCPSERALALAAKRYLQRHLELARDTRLREVPCSGHNFGRRCAQLLIDGTDVGATMIEAGLAEHYDCSRGCPRRKNWCQKDQSRGIQ